MKTFIAGAACAMCLAFSNAQARDYEDLGLAVHFPPICKILRESGGKVFDYEGLLKSQRRALRYHIGDLGAEGYAGPYTSEEEFRTVYVPRALRACERAKRGATEIQIRRIIERGDK